MLTVDPDTAVLFAAGSVGLALILCLALRRGQQSRGPTRWLLASNAAFLVASFGVLGSGLIPFAISSALVIAGAYAGISFALFAVLEGEEQPPPWRLVGVLGLVSLCIQTAVAARTGSVILLMATSSAVNTALTLYAVRSVWRVTRGYGNRVATLMCLPFAIICAGYAVRLPVVAIRPDTDLPLVATALIIVALAGATVMLELALIAVRESRALAAMQKALAEAEAARAARTRFLLAISHDLRTPLNGILGLSALMKGQALGTLPEVYRPHVAQIHRSGTDRSELVSDLLVHASEGGTSEPAADVETIDRAVRQKFGEDAA